VRCRWLDMRDSFRGELAVASRANTK